MQARKKNSPYARRCIAVTLMGSAVFLTTPLAHAQVGVGSERDAAEQRRALERETQLREQQDRTPDIRLPKPPSEAPRLLPDSETPCFTIQQLLLRGEESARFAWVLDALGGAGALDSPQHKCLGAKGIAMVLQRAQDAVVARGFVTTRVLAEPQDLSSGTLTLTVLPGRIRSIRFTEPINSRATAWNAVPAKPGDILNLRDIEQALENFKRVPTAEADIQIAPAEGDTAQPGQSDLLIAYKQGMPLRLALTADDSGSKSTGKYQGSVTLSYDNWWTLNDLFYVTFNHDLGGGDAGPRGTEGVTTHYSVPWGNWLLASTVSHSSYDQTVAGINQNYVYHGTSNNAELKLSRLLYRDNNRKTRLSLKAFARESHNFIDDTEVQVQRRVVGGWELGVGHKEFVGQATLEANLAYKRGTGAFGSLPAPEEAFGEGTSRFALISADVNLSLPFKLGDQSWRYNGNVRGQNNRTPLTPQDRFAIAGRYTVRGFDGESSLSAENGWLIRNELAAVLGHSAQEIYLGIDHGEVGGPSSSLLVGKRLTGMAIGLRGGFKNLQYDMFIGAPVSKPTGFKTASSVAGFSVNVSF
jgi:hemolysin activation/secretion protein